MCCFIYIKSLKIKKKNEILRDMDFRVGLNLIIDETPISDVKLTGNNVGKTTVLKLIDYCLGGKASAIYTDEENKKEIYKLVKKYLIDEDIMIELELTEDLFDPSANKIVIKRNFIIKKKKCIRQINGEQVTEKDFEDELTKLIFLNHVNEKPSFRQIISHNIRYKDESINNTIKTLNKYTTDVEYETLYLFLLGCAFDDGASKLALSTKVSHEEAFKKRLENVQTKNAYEISLVLVEDEIKKLNNRKETMKVNEDFEQDLERLNLVKYQINKSSSLISKLNIRKNIIDEAQVEMELKISNIDLKQLEQLYSETTTNINGIQKSFEQLFKFHNNMLNEKIKFITAELPELITKIDKEQENINRLLNKEKELSGKIAKSDSFEDLEIIISGLNENHRLKGEYEIIISQIEDVEHKMKILRKEIQKIDEQLFSEEFETTLKEKIKVFNKYFSLISTVLYDEKYALKYEKITNKKKQRLYQFSAFNTNMSSGKKQGEIVCFDLAYMLFAEEQRMPYLHFLLNDKKELMHNNQLSKVAEFVKNNRIQFVVSILKDKLPEGMEDEGHVVVKLSQENKLLKIESNTLYDR